MRPPAPEWNPPFELAEPGWKDSKVPLCTERFGVVGGPWIWSDATATYALLSVECNPLANVACGGEGTSLYANQGKGWSRLKGINDGFVNAGLTGFPGGPLVVFNDTDCGIDLVERSGGSRCSFKDTNFDGVRDVFAVSDGVAYALVGQQMLKYSAGAWSPFASLSIGTSGVIWAQGDSVVVGAFNQFAARVSPSGVVTPIAGAPAGDYTDVWAFGDDVWLGNRVGHLVHYDGTAWEVVDTQINDEILGLWGAADGTLYYFGARDFGRVKNGVVERLARGTAEDGWLHFTSIWGNSSNEVFLGVRDENLQKYDCSGAFTVFFDGAKFHQF